MTKRLNLAVITFSGCNGCLNALLCNPVFASMLENIKFSYFPLLIDPSRDEILQTESRDHTLIKADFATDIESLPEVDVALVEGSVYAKEHRHIAEMIRTKTKTLVALGTCAHIGGVLSLAVHHGVTRNVPLTDVVNVDAIIPGCPPPSNLIGNAILRLTRGEVLAISDRTLCTECPLRGEIARDTRFRIGRLRPNPGEIITKCFLSQGILCLGPITREGCGYRCINAGMPCEGCFGAVKNNLVGDLFNFLAILDFDRKIIDPTLFFKYTRPAGLTGNSLPISNKSGEARSDGS